MATKGLLLIIAGMLTTAAAVAQPVGSRSATRIDSLRAGRDGKVAYFPALFTFRTGKQVRGYVTDYAPFLFERVTCYEMPPDQLPPPPAKALSIERLTAMTVDGHMLQALDMNGKPLKMLAENMTPGGSLQTFGYAITKADMYIPVPILGMGGALVPVGSHEKYFWYVQMKGQTLREVPRGDKAFAALMAEAFADYPALATRVQQRTAGSQFKDMPALVKDYNAHFAALPTAK